MVSTALRIVVALDSFKGSIDATPATAAFADGWSMARPTDDVVQLPMADGGEGTIDVIEKAAPGSRRMPIIVTGPDGQPTAASWLLCPDGTAVVEMASTSGLPLIRVADPLGATSRGLGEVLLAATLTHGVRRILLGLGGSATTDGGAGALSALGAKLIDDDGAALQPGGGALRELADINLDDILPPPPEGVICLVDVTSPLLGPLGAARQFGPQKGASATDVAVLEESLTRWAARLTGDPTLPGTGAAGGTAYGLAAGWQAQLTPGASLLATTIRLPEAIADADLVVTGEGRFDSQSLRGKVVGHVLTLAAVSDTPSLVVAGSVGPVPDIDLPDLASTTLDLTALAGSREAAMAEPARWITLAGRLTAQGI